MRRKADQLVRRIPDMHERFAPTMIDTFKFAPPPVKAAPPETPKLNGVSLLESPSPKKPNGLSNGVPETPTPPSSIARPLVPLPGEPKVIIRAGLDSSFEDRPALERTPQGMAFFSSLDAQMDEYLSSWNVLDESNFVIEEPMAIDGVGMYPIDLNQQLLQIIANDDELAEWKEIVEMPIEEDSMVVDSKSDTSLPTAEATVNGNTKKRKRLVHPVFSLAKS